MPHTFEIPEEPGALGFRVPVGSADLEGSIRFPEGRLATRAVALLIPDFGPWNRDGDSPLGPGDPRPAGVTALLLEFGYAVAAYDKRGAGSSSADRNVPFARHYDDAAAVLAFLDSGPPPLRTGGVLLVGIGAGCLHAAALAERPDAARAALFLYPPLPDFRSAFARGPASEAARAALDAVGKLPPDARHPFLVASPDPLAVHIGSSPAEAAELLALDVPKALSRAACRTLAVHDAPAAAGLHGPTLTEFRVASAADGDKVRWEILRFLAALKPPRSRKVEKAPALPRPDPQVPDSAPSPGP